MTTHNIYLGTSNDYHNRCFHGEISKISTIFGRKNTLPGVCLCCGFTAQSTQWGHVID